MNSKTENIEASISRKAFHLVREKRVHGVSKQRLKDQNIQAITSIGTERNYQSHVRKYLSWRWSLRLSIDGPYPAEHAQDFFG